MVPFHSTADFWFLGPLPGGGPAKRSLSSEIYLKINTDETAKFPHTLVGVFFFFFLVDEWKRLLLLGAARRWHRSHGDPLARFTPVGAPGAGLRASPPRC